MVLYTAGLQAGQDVLSEDFSSSNKESIAREISDFREATVLFRSSVPYRCFTSAQREAFPTKGKRLYFPLLV